MSGIKVIHTGDFHIGASRTHAINGKSEIKNTFFRVINLCRTENIDFLLIAGDLFDTPFADSDTVSEVIGAMSQIPETVIAIAPGNHDHFCDGSVYSESIFPENVVIFAPGVTTFDFPHKNVTLFGAAFSDRYEKNSIMTLPDNMNPDRINIGILHGDLVSSSAENNYNPITQNYISLCGLDYLALGHIHKRSAITTLGNTRFAYCGCPDGKGFDEDGSHGIYIGTISKNSYDITYRELSSRKYIITETDIRDCTTSLEVSSKILNQIKCANPGDYADNLYRITLTGTLNTDFSPNIALITENLSNQLFYIRLTDETEPNSEDISSIAAENSLRGIFVSKMTELIRSASEKDSEKYRTALKLGLKAFEREVTLNDN